MDSSLNRSSTTPAQGLELGALKAKADQGDVEAQFGLGLHYGSADEEGLGFAQAASWYHKAAEQGHALAQFNLGVMFARGQGVLRDDAAAARWTRKAAEAGDAGAQYALGVRCHRASLDARQIDTIESRIEAYKWLNLAAVQGYKDSLTACQRLVLTMSRAEFDEGNRRAALFVAQPSVNPQIP